MDYVKNNFPPSNFVSYLFRFSFVFIFLSLASLSISTPGSGDPPAPCAAASPISEAHLRNLVGDGKKPVVIARGTLSLSWRLCDQFGTNCSSWLKNLSHWTCGMDRNDPYSCLTLCDPQTVDLPATLVAAVSHSELIFGFDNDGICNPQWKGSGLTTLNSTFETITVSAFSTLTKRCYCGYVAKRTFGYQPLNPSLSGFVGDSCFSLFSPVYKAKLHEYATVEAIYYATGTVVPAKQIQ